MDQVSSEVKHPENFFNLNHINKDQFSLILAENRISEYKLTMKKSRNETR